MIKASFCAFSAVLILAGCSDSKNADIARNDAPAAEPTPSKLDLKEEPKTTEKSSTASDKPGDKSTDPTDSAPEAPEKPAKVAVSGTVWSTGRISVTTDDGIFSVPAGRPLRVVKQTAVGYVVTDDKTEFDVTEAQVSTNSALGASVQQAEAAAHAERMRAQATAAQQAFQQKKERSIVEGKTAAIEKQRRDLQARLDALTKEETTLEASIRQAQAQSAQAREARALGRAFTSTRNVSAAQEEAWSARLWEVKKAKIDVSDQIDQIPR
jgi:hypothetical protein